jgi:hypothetical protein
MPARHRYHHSSKRRKSFTITLESVFMFAWNRRSRCAGNSVHGGREYAVGGLENPHSLVNLVEFHAFHNSTMKPPSSMLCT